MERLSYFLLKGARCEGKKIPILAPRACSFKPCLGECFHGSHPETLDVRLRSLRRVVRRVMRVALRDVSVVRGFLVVPCGVLVGVS